MGGINWGALAGGAAAGYSKGLEDQRKQAEEKRRQDAADREEAYRKEVEGLVPPGNKAKVEVSPATQTVNPIAARGISPDSFSENMEQSGTGNPLAPGKPATPRSIAANGIGEIAKPEQNAPAAPNVADMLDYATRRAAIDVKHGKLNGLGIMQLVQARRQLEDEGVKDAMLKIHNGNVQAGIDAFNQYGKRRVKLIDSKQIETEVSGIKMPTTEVTIEDENGTRQTINAAQMLNGFRKMENQLDFALKQQQFKQTAKHQDATLAETRDYHKGVLDVGRERVAVERTKAENSGGLTVPQQRINEEIDTAREYVGGMSQEEILLGTQQYSATGRENPKYDPTLASKVRQANRRKYGDDPDFGSTVPKQPDIATRFSTDPSMKGRRLGNKTPQGVEVLDASGKLIGHYN